MRRFTTLLTIIAILVCIGHSMADKAGSKGKEPELLREGWEREVEVPAVKDSSANILLRAAKIKLWVEKGWLLARRETEAGDLEWQIVLAQTKDSKPPHVRVDQVRGGVEISYGTFFVREAVGMLRVLRERKTVKSPPWPQIPLAAKAKDFVKAQNGDLNIEVHGWFAADWAWATSGLPSGPADVLVRLQRLELGGGGYGGQGLPQMARVDYGSRRFQDEGDLLLAERSLAEAAEGELQAVKIRKEMGKKPAPALVVREWINLDAEPSLEKLRGKVVLLDFWGKWCGPCVQKLPEVQRLHEKFKDRGLVVLGVHSAHESEKVAEFLKEKKITFPVVVDKGETEKRYAIEAWPTYFLIDRTGRVVWGFANTPPREDQIEELLRQPTPALKK